MTERTRKTDEIRRAGDPLELKPPPPLPPSRAERSRAAAYLRRLEKLHGHEGETCEQAWQRQQEEHAEEWANEDEAAREAEERRLGLRDTTVRVEVPSEPPSVGGGEHRPRLTDEEWLALQRWREERRKAAEEDDGAASR